MNIGDLPNIDSYREISWRANRIRVATRIVFGILLGLMGFTRQTDAIWADELAGEETPVPVEKAFVDGTGPGWVALAEPDFVKVNSAPDTWSWKAGVLYCTGKPVSVTRTKMRYTNFEFVCQWRHRSKGGNSGVFVWTTDESLERLAANGKPGLPDGIEVQVLDLGYAEQYEKEYQKPADWFTSHGDVFSVGKSRMNPFAPATSDGRRSFPTKHLSRGVDQWNHYYVRAINGEIRLWVNGEEVSGGNDCHPRQGYLCLESEGAPVEFRGLQIRELP